MGYSLVRPCADCPFRADRPFYLRSARAEEISEALRRGAEFHCHKTVDYGRMEEDRYNPGGGEEFCAGALIILENTEGPNQMMRIAERIGLYDPSRLDLDAPVYESLEAFVEAMRRLDGR